MRRMWVPWSTGAGVQTLAGASTLRLFLLSIVEGSTVLDRKVQRMTTQRTLMSMWFSSREDEFITVTVGMILLPRDLPLSNLTPADDSSADWQYHEEFAVENTLASLATNIHRDVKTIRKTEGLATEFYMYVQNRSGASVLDMHLSGRTLVLSE